LKEDKKAGKHHNVTVWLESFFVIATHYVTTLQPCKYDRWDAVPRERNM